MGWWVGGCLGWGGGWGETISLALLLGHCLGVEGQGQPHVHIQGETGHFKQPVIRFALAG